MIEQARLENFTAFEELALDFSPGINLFVGANGTGKTHLLKLLYVALAASEADVRRQAAFEEKLTNVFRPSDKRLGRLAHRVKGSVTCRIDIEREGRHLEAEFTNHSKEHVKRYRNEWPDDIRPAVYIPVKEVLVEAPGFRSLYEQGILQVEEIYFDIVSKAFVPIPSGKPPQERKALTDRLQEVIQGRVTEDDEQFYLQSERGTLEFPLVAEGFRKFGLLWRLIQNGTLLRGATLLWDEPEANINPSMIRTLVQTLLDLQRQGIQVFSATHSYVVLREFDLQRAPDDQVRYFNLRRDGTTGITSVFGDEYLDIVPNEVADAYADVYDLMVERSLGL